MSCSRWLLSMSLLVLAGCTDADDEPVLVEYENTGMLCVLGDGDHPNTSYVENQSVDVHVKLDCCAGSFASDEITSSCSIERVGSTLRVSASASYWMATSGATTNEFRSLMATCTTEPLAAGTYTVEYAGQATTFEVPSMGMAARIGPDETFLYSCSSF